MIQKPVDRKRHLLTIDTRAGSATRTGAEFLLDGVPLKCVTVIRISAPNDDVVRVRIEMDVDIAAHIDVDNHGLLVSTQRLPDDQVTR